MIVLRSHPEAVGRPSHSATALGEPGSRMSMEETMAEVVGRRLPVGAGVVPGGVHFRVWAPLRKTVEVVFRGDPTSFSLQSEPSGYFSGLVQNARTQSLYKYRLDRQGEYPDPASRFQPEGPDHWSQVIDPDGFQWTDVGWCGITPRGQVIYEMHVGTFTRQGLWDAALLELPRLVETGVTVLEIMPVAEFPGRFGWGYDGVHPFAPTRLYGEPDDFRRFVNRAHALGLGVILDVVYNHVGPVGNYFAQFSPHYFSDSHSTDLGPAINFDSSNSGPVREFYIANAVYWIDEFHLDGLRLDATQDIYDESDEHILSAIAQAVRQKARPRQVMLVAENEPQNTKLVRSIENGGYGVDAIWNDDFHHSAMVLLTGHNEAYYTDYLGSPQEFISAIKHGFLYQGQHYKWQNQRRGTPSLDLVSSSFVLFIQNHDQVANSAYGLRCHALTDPGRYRAITALLLLAPGIPMLFQGQEFAASSPFLYFADLPPKQGQGVERGRAKFLRQFRSLSTPEMASRFEDPGDPKTFERSKLDHSEREPHTEAYALHRDLLKLRRTDPVFNSPREGSCDGAVLSPHAFVLRFFAEGANDRLLLFNFGLDLHLNPAPEPLLAPPEDRLWRTLFSTEDPA
jgi:maltooligosyltrehalose trehalohydrolase